jgi:hypothetical protein
VGIAVKFMEYAWAVAGMEHPPDKTGIALDDPAESIGPPKGPLEFLVSRMRHGVTG